MQRLISSLFFSFLFLIVYAQSIDPVFRHITRSSGLPVDEVTCISQDSIGFIWIGTKEGLYRYDGFSFKGFYHKPGDLETIPGNYVSRVYVDSRGLLWIATSRSGLAVMRSDGKVMQVINSITGSADPGLNHVYDVKEDKEGFFWCTTSDGLVKLKSDNGNVKVVKRIDVTRYNHATNNLGPFVFDTQNKLWICTLKGLVIYDPAKSIFLHAKNNPAQLPFLNDTLAIANVYCDEEQGKIWYSTWEPATRVYDTKMRNTNTIYSGKGLTLPDYGQVVNHFLRDSQKNLWMATGSGVSLYVGNSRKIFLHENDNPSSLIHSGVGAICEDREGNFWFGTPEGISITRPYHQAFLNLSSNSAKEYAFAEKPVGFIVAADSNTILIGCEGLYETDTSFHVKKHFHFGTMDDWVWTYYKDEDRKQIYISTQVGMLLYDMKTHSLKKLTIPPFDERRPVSSFVRINDEEVWMSGYRNYFLKYNVKNRTFKKYNLLDLGEEASILKLYRDRDNNLWIVSQGTGLLRFDEKSEKIVERIVVNAGGNQGLLQGNIIAIQDLGKDVFVGYVSKGFSLYNKATKTFRHFSQSDGLVSNSITDVVKTKDGRVWIATTNGISRFDTARKEFINYNYSNGILQNNFVSITQLPDGRIAAGSIKGMVLLHPDSININTKLPPPIITGISIYGKKISTDSLLSHDIPLHVSYKENYFSIDYISLCYDNNQQIEYAYRMEGFDKDWIPAANRRFVSFANLHGGNYHFQVKARIPGGDWIESEFPLTVIVHPAFYNRWWFYALCALLAAAIIYSIFRYRLQQLVRLEKMRTSISSDLHDEVGATLSSISIFSEMAKKSVDASSKAEPYLRRIGDRSRESIEKMSDIIWSINPENDSLQQMMVRMKNYVNEVLEAKDIIVHWSETENLPALKLSMAQRKNFYLLFKEIINNAAKYSCAKNIFIELSMNDKFLFLKIEDDGIGFDLQTVQLGNGIKNITQRAALLNGNLTILSTPGKGTSISLFFDR